MVMTDNTKVRQITRAYKQHNSLTTTIPLCARHALCLKQADFIVWSVDVITKRVVVKKVRLDGEKNG